MKATQRQPREAKEILVEEWTFKFLGGRTPRARRVLETRMVPVAQIVKQRPERVLYVLVGRRPKIVLRAKQGNLYLNAIVHDAPRCFRLLGLSPSRKMEIPYSPRGVRQGETITVLLPKIILRVT